MSKKFKPGFYQKYIKRLLDIACSFAFLFAFWWLYVVIAILVRIKLGSPVLFKQPRPGKNEEIFDMYKFRTMTDEKDEDGNLLPDDIRLTKFGEKMRALSLDELPEIWLIFTGKMSILGPRPLLVRDMVFMSKVQRMRHFVRPGLSGLAQVKGRNGIDWEKKLKFDVTYVKHITFCRDVKILFLTIFKVFRQEGITEEGMKTAEDFGDYLLKHGKISKCDYEKRQAEARKRLARR